MDTASQILLIIVSTFLSLFLLVSIILLVKLIKLIKSVNRVAEKAEHLVDSAEAATELLRKTAGPVAVGKFIANIVESVVKRRK
jgi:hypothetical protein